jgi:hypothetical protein
VILINERRNNEKKREWAILTIQQTIITTKSDSATLQSLMAAVEISARANRCHYFHYTPASSRHARPLKS